MFQASNSQRCSSPRFHHVDDASRELIERVLRSGGERLPHLGSELGLRCQWNRCRRQRDFLLGKDFSRPQIFPFGDDHQRKLQFARVIEPDPKK